MKKKGRICGTIGVILSLALAGGTVVYGRWFDKNAAGKAEKFVGSSTGNVFQGWFGGKGFTKTKALVDETGKVLDGAEGEFTYKSFSLRVTENYTSEEKGEGNEKTTLVGGYSDTVLFTDANYTYVKTTSRTEIGRSVTLDAIEYVLDKESGVWYGRTNTAVGTETPSDVKVLDKAKWQKAEGMSVAELFAALEAGFASGTSCKIDPTGTYRFKDTASVEGAAEGSKAEITFTVGLTPTIMQSVYIAGMNVKGTTVYEYSDLNNTKVSVPESLKEVMAK